MTATVTDWYADVAKLLSGKVRDGADNTTSLAEQRAWVDTVVAALEAGERTVEIPAHMSCTGEAITVRFPARVATMSGAR